MFSYNTWMLILAAGAALTLPFTAISSVIDLLSYRSRLSRPSAGPDMITTARLRWRSLVLGLLASFSLFGLVFSTYALISVPGPSGPRGAQGPPGAPDTHVATAYWYRVELNKLRDLLAKWDSVTQNELKNYLVPVHKL